ncbi:hypothetical protein MIMGU_mgv1a025459mg, partial [Erythranthe guttata]
TISDDQYYQTCGKTFNCGEIVTGIRYPFRGFSDPPYCGHPNLTLTCEPEKNNITTIEILGLKYRVLEIAQTTQTMTIAREDVMEETCPVEMKNTTLDYSIFDFATIYTNITFLYGCPHVNLVRNIWYVSCGNSSSRGSAFVSPGIVGPENCQYSVIVPFPVTDDGNSQIPDELEMDRILQQGFEIRWKIASQACSNCTASKGRCGYDLAKNQTACYCRDPPYVSDICPFSEISVTPPPLPNVQMPLFFTRLGLLSECPITGHVTTQRNWVNAVTDFRLNLPYQNIEMFLLKHVSLSLKGYKYSEIKKITKSISDELGRGGYGSVYKGVLPDGSLVAVKILTEAGGNGEEFINEVASISRTSHVNIRALVYEFMPNKSLDKFINKNNCLDLDKLYEIAVGVAKGLPYLHTGCNTRIVHFDFKPQNILLDEEFSPNISDFGLAKLCKKKQSILSIIGA